MNHLRGAALMVGGGTTQRWLLWLGGAPLLLPLATLFGLPCHAEAAELEGCA